jgi:soluble lytic murein transglycosylase
VKFPGLIFLSFLFLLGGGWAAGQEASQPQPSATPPAAARKPPAKSLKTGNRKPRAAASSRVQRLHRAFVASSSLRPMARQLLETRSPAAYAGVEQYALRHSQSDAGALAWLAAGYAHVLDHDYARAIVPLKRALLHAGDLRDYVVYYLATAYAATGKSDLAAAALATFASDYPDSLFRRDAMLAYGVALLESGRPGEAVQVLEKYRNPARADFELAVARAYLKAGQPQAAAAALQHVYYVFPASSEAAPARTLLDQLAAQAAAPPAGFAERKARAERLAQLRHNEEAVREYRELLDDPAAPDRAAVQVALGVALHHSGKDREARNVLESVPAAPGDANGLRWLTLAEIARAANDDAAFANAVNRLRQTAGAGDSLEQALWLGGNMCLLRKDYGQAIDLYRELQQRFPNGKHAAYAHWKAAWLTLRQGRRPEAARAFQEHVTLYPGSPEVPAAMYWRARLAEEDGDSGLARAWYATLTYRFSQYYYAELARARMRALPAGAAKHDPVLDNLPLPVLDTNLGALADDPPAESVPYHKSLLLHNGGMTDLAVKELRAAAPEGAGWAAMVTARFYQEDGLYHRALETLKSAVPAYYSLELGALPRPCWEILFPRPYWTDLTRYARQNALDPYLVAALIRQESAFNPGAVSSAEALGLMQLMPNTGRQVARELRLRRYADRQLVSPGLNLRLGARYFHDLLAQFGGRLEYALAAYNAGSDRVQEWLAGGNYRGPDEFVESIPFTETREYVQAIIRNAAIYRRLYARPGPLPHRPSAG